MSTATVHQLHPTDTNRVFDAELAAQFRRPFALTDLQFKIQGGRKDGGSEIVCYVNARAVAARLNLLCPGEWHTRTRALPPEMRPHRVTDRHIEFIKVDWQNKASVDHSLQYECILTIRGCDFEGIGAGSDSKAAHSDSLKRAAVRAGIGEMLYACKTPAMYRPGPKDQSGAVTYHPMTHRIAKFLELPPAKLALGVEDGRAVLTKTNRDALLVYYRKWLDLLGRAAYGDPLSHGPDVEEALGLDDSEVDGVSLSETEEGETHTDVPHQVSDPQPPAPQGSASEQGAVVLEFPAATEPAAPPVPSVAPLATPTEQTVKRITDAATKLGEVSANAITLLGAVLLERDAAEKGSFPIADEEAVSDLIHHLELVEQAGWSGSRLEDVVERAFTRDATPVERRQAFLTQLALNPDDPAAA